MKTKNKKLKLREELILQRDSIELSVKQAYDDSIISQLETLIYENSFHAIHAYLPIRSEVNVFPLLNTLLENKLRVVCPKTLPHRNMEHYELLNIEAIQEGLWGTFYPKGDSLYKGSYDMIIVPALAYDCNNRRLGYGGGYYDTFLENHKEALTVGVAYSFQILTEIPYEAHDAMLDLVISPC